MEIFIQLINALIYMYAIAPIASLLWQCCMSKWSAIERMTNVKILRILISFGIWYWAMCQNEQWSLNLSHNRNSVAKFQSISNWWNDSEDSSASIHLLTKKDWSAYVSSLVQRDTEYYNMLFHILSTQSEHSKERTM